ncbi:MAG: helix-turn-helix domain-containing protein [Coxiellaceae bacterium]|jgi:transcriptional regulator with XRE-family HTH domain|nr:helix-turn-helix domain-containing protein [Coxiellaceae bacterium]
MKDALQQTPGKMFREARESQQISLNDVAKVLLLSKRIITAIEEDDYSKIAAAVYAEGYLKAYAKFLQLPVKDILASYHRLNAYSNDDFAKLTVKSSSDKIKLPWLLSLLSSFKNCCQSGFKKYCKVGCKRGFLLFVVILGCILWGYTRKLIVIPHRIIPDSILIDREEKSTKPSDIYSSSLNVPLEIDSKKNGGKE